MRVAAGTAYMDANGVRAVTQREWAKRLQAAVPLEEAQLRIAVKELEQVRD